MNSRSRQEEVQGQLCPHLEGAEVAVEHHQEGAGEVVECCYQLPYPLPLQVGEGKSGAANRCRQLHCFTHAGLRSNCALDTGSRVQTREQAEQVCLILLLSSAHFQREPA